MLQVRFGLSWLTLLSLSDLKSILKHEVRLEYKKVIASHGDSFIFDAGFKLLLNDSGLFLPVKLS